MLQQPSHVPFELLLDAWFQLLTAPPPPYHVLDARALLEGVELELSNRTQAIEALADELAATQAHQQQQVQQLRAELAGREQAVEGLRAAALVQEHQVGGLQALLDSRDARLAHLSAVNGALERLQAEAEVQAETIKQLQRQLEEDVQARWWGGAMVG